jgi:HEPN domain-containing protein
VNRWRDWWHQAERDIRHAEHASEDADFEWSAFASHQAAEKAVKALILSRGGEPWGHSVTRLVQALPEDVKAPEAAVNAAKRLDKHYIPARYPNGFDAGFPGELYTEDEARKALEDARTLIDLVRRHLPG